MLKFIKHHLDTITGVGVYPSISFLIFFGFFLLVLLWVWKVSRSHIAYMASLPLTDDLNRPETGPHAH
ncbi:MAG: CcoQ/FixQ family Cbb3-type cytochrome c oxidase assembly chaperone [Flavobacteriales bacterium]